MDGKIWVESEPGKGSVFHFTVRFGLQTAAQVEQGPIDFKGLRASGGGRPSREPPHPRGHAETMEHRSARS